MTSSERGRGQHAMFAFLLGFRVLGFRVLGFRYLVFGFRIQGLGFREALSL